MLKITSLHLPFAPQERSEVMSRANNLFQLQLLLKTIWYLKRSQEDRQHKYVALSKLCSWDLSCISKSHRNELGASDSQTAMPFAFEQGV